MTSEPSKRLRNRILFCVGLGVCVLSGTAIAVAETWMPDNYHGRVGVLTFYRTHGPMLVAWAGIAGWSLGRSRSLEPRPGH